MRTHATQEAAMKTTRPEAGARALTTAAMLMLLALIAAPEAARAQTPWSTPDPNNIHSTNSGNVGVGAANPTSKLQVVAGYDGDGVRVAGSTAGSIDPGFGLYDG